MNKLPILPITLLLLLISLGLNLLLYKELKNTFISLYQTSLNPIGINRYNSDIAERKVPKVVFFGDSRAYQWKAPKNDNFQFINRGIGGQTTGQILGRFEHHITPLQPDVIVLQLGVNDLRMLSSPSQTRADLVDNCQKNIARIIQQAQKINATVIVTTLFPLGSGNFPFKHRPFTPDISDIEQNIREINQYLKSLDDVIILDAYSLLSSKDPDKVKYYKDLLHINQTGYELINQELEKILLKTTTN